MIFFQKLTNKFWFIPPLILLSSQFKIVSVKGRSMSPTLNPNTHKENDYILTFATFNVEKNDICVFIHPDYPNIMVCKRVEAVGGDLVLNNGKVERVPDGMFWATSDEPFHSSDSKDFGPVPLGLIKGKALGIVWPFDRFKSL